MHAWATIAYVAKAKNLQGGLVVRATAGLPFLLSPGLEVAFVPPVLDAPRRATVKAIEEQGNDLLVFFTGVDSRTTAERLAGRYCLARRADLPEDALLAGAGLVGWSVVDKQADFSGSVADVLENPGQALLELVDAEGRIVLVPFVDEFIEGFDEEARVIRLCAPAGLFDLQ